MKKKVKLALKCSIAAIPLLLSIPTFAWFNDTTTNHINLNSVVHGSYFESGNGSEENPFEIARPTQLYYLAWLQEMGYFNMVDSDTGTINQNYFVLTEDLDMSEFVLPPIGTTTYPFVGNFDGQGHKIDNLTVHNTNYTYNPHEDGSMVGDVEIVGFFGVIGTLDEPSSNGSYTTSDYKVIARDSITGEPTTTKYSYSNSVVSVSDFYISTCTIKTQTTNSLIGIVAGYVNGSMSGVGVINSNIAIKEGTKPLTYTNNLSDYSLVGFCRDEYINERTLDPTITPGISVPGGTEDVIIEDAGNQWGDSVDMKSMFDNLTSIRTSASTVSNSNNPQYVDSETFIYDEVADTTELYSSTTAGLNSHKYDTSSKYYKKADLGSFYFSDTTANYIYLNGADTDDQAKTVTTITLTDEYRDAFYIAYNTNYLSINANKNGVTNQTNVSNATKWMIDSSNHIYMNEMGDNYYLNANGESFAISTTASTTWTKTTNTICINVGYSNINIKSYIIYNSGWKISNSIDCYYITDGNGNYLSLSSTSAITNVTTQASATKWYFSNPDTQSGIVAGFYNGTLVYLRNNSGKLNASTSTSTSWSNSGTYLYNNTYRIIYSLSWKLSTTLNTNTYYTISSGTNYLSNNGTSIVNGNSTNATKWLFSNTGDNPSGTVSVDVNGTTYYLTINRSSLSLSTTSSSLTNSSGKLRNSSSYYVRYNSGWTGTNKSNNGSTLTFTSYSITDVYGAVSQVSTGGNTLVLTDTTSRISTKTIENNKMSGVPTYYPLSMDKNGNIFSTNPANTGYVISGGMTGIADIRVSKYTIDDIKTSYSSGSDDFKKDSNGNYIVKTIDTRGDHYISPTDVENFKKFTDSKDSLIPVLKSGSSNVYGLHFMKTSISKDRIIQADQATINNVTYNDPNKKYDLPLDCIDFNLNSKGYVNFFAGTYYAIGNTSENKSFFSFHQIFRDESGYNITDIKEIAEIYGSTDQSDPFIYRYTDGTYSEPLTSSYSSIFNTNWIKTQSSLDQYSIYYYEIPVNEGEYALGSDPSSNGAYLLYLDISANKQSAKRTYYVDTQIITTDTIRTPNGVAFVKEGHNDPSTIDTMNSATYQLGRTGGTDANPIYYSNATESNGDIGSGANFNRTYDEDLDRDKIEVKTGDNIDNNVIATYIGSYTENDETKNIFSNPPGYDSQGNELGQTPYKREYVSSYAITYSDLNQQSGITTKTVISCFDTTINYLDGTQIITRIITFDVYVTLKNETNERHVLSFYTDSINDTEKINFSYSLSTGTNAYYFTLLYNDGTSTNKTLTSHITLMNQEGTSYTIYINGNAISGSPSEENPINFTTSETTSDFTTLFLTRDENDPDNN